MPNTKKCCCHSQLKYFPDESPIRPVTDFHKYAESPDGLQPMCRWCKQKSNVKSHAKGDPKSNAKLRLRMIAETGKPGHVTKFDMEQRAEHEAEVARLREVVAANA